MFCKLSPQIVVLRKLNVFKESLAAVLREHVYLQFVHTYIIKVYLWVPALLLVQNMNINTCCGLLVTSILT